MQEIVDNDNDNTERQEIEQKLQKIIESIDTLDDPIGIELPADDSNDTQNLHVDKE